MDLIVLSRTISHALRHEPWLYELELGDEGWVSVDCLVEALRAERVEWAGLASDDIEEMIARSEKKRHEMRGGQIRAYYGHSVPQRLKMERQAPPAVLYHGTSPVAAGTIMVEGLKPMGRQYVHLSADRETALMVGSRKSSEPTILEIDAALASEAGSAFYHGNEMVWLADVVPNQFIR